MFLRNTVDLDTKDGIVVFKISHAENHTVKLCLFCVQRIMTN
jgi:hypothetical protein